MVPRRTDPRNARVLPFLDVIGLHVVVVRHPDPSIEGASGVIVWETSRTLHVQRPDGRVIVVLKPGGVFLFDLPGGGRASVKGEKLLGRPAERAARLRWVRSARA